MALEKRVEIEVVYTNDRMETDVKFSTIFDTLPKRKIETVVVENAYFAIDGIEGDKNQISFVVTMYNNANRECVLKRQPHTFVPDVSTNDTPNFYAQAYNFLKTQPEYVDAINC